jgi:hypothetical protein
LANLPSRRGCVSPAIWRNSNKLKCTPAEPAPAIQNGGIIILADQQALELEQGLRRLTGQYLDARYSLRPVTPEQAAQAESFWARFSRKFHTGRE